MANYRKRKTNRPQSEWTDQTKVQVVTQYLALGKAPLVEALTGVPRQTIRLWKTKPWWGELVRQIQAEDNQETDAKLTKIIDRSLDIINDRLENGELILNSKTGQAVRLPVKLRDVSVVTRDLFQQRDKIRNAPAEREREEAQADRLLKLAETFAEFAKAVQTKAPRREAEIEGEVIENADIREIPETQGEVQSLALELDREKSEQVERLPA